MKQPPFLLPPAEAISQLLGTLPAPPEWMQDEARNRLVLLLNHVLAQEPAAMERLRRQAGKTVHACWGQWSLWLEATPAGLLAQTQTTESADLQLGVNAPSALSLAQTVLTGGKPALSIQGDVQLAADVAWLVDNVGWDLEEDLARWLGDASAHTLVLWARSATEGLKSMLGAGTGAAAS